MAFENLTTKFTDAFRKLTGKGKLSEEDIKEALRDVRLALLEADVNYKVVKDFIEEVRIKIDEARIFDSLTPGQNVIKVVKDALIAMLGQDEAKLTQEKDLSIYVMVGLQGSGKTTHTAKLAKRLKTKGNRPLVVACDVYRPAAIEQLKVVAKTANVDFFSLDGTKDVVAIAKAGIGYARQNGNNMVLIDTAGRLQIDNEMMSELVNLKEAVHPTEILLVVDSMIGQEAVAVASSFNEQLAIDGIIMTKLDSDARGGATLSIRKVTGKPIKYIGTGEKLDDLEEFYPDRMAGRILGMGDILSLIEKVEDVVELENAKKLEAKLKKADFTFSDFLVQMQQIKKMGSLKEIMKMIPGFSSMKELDSLNIDDKQIGHIEAIIQSMTNEERNNPDVLDASRKRRISKGSGRDIQEVNKLIKQFDESKKMLKMMMNTKGGKMPFKLPF